MLKILTFTCLIALGVGELVQDVPAFLDKAEAHPSMLIIGINKINTPPHINSHPSGFEISPSTSYESGYIDSCGVIEVVPENRTGC